MREALVQKHVVAGLRAGGCLVKKTHGNQYQVGLPDLYVLSNGRHCWVEVKRPPSRPGFRDGGELRPEQVIVFTEIRNHGGRIFVGDDADELIRVVAEQWTTFGYCAAAWSPE